MTSQQLKAERVKRKLSQSQMAKALNTPLSTYIKWETGRRRVPGIVEVAIKAI